MALLTNYNIRLNLLFTYYYKLHYLKWDGIFNVIR